MFSSFLYQRTLVLIQQVISMFLDYSYFGPVQFDLIIVVGLYIVHVLHVNSNTFVGIFIHSMSPIGVIGCLQDVQNWWLIGTFTETLLHVSFSHWQWTSIHLPSYHPISPIISVRCQIHGSSLLVPFFTWTVNILLCFVQNCHQRCFIRIQMFILFCREILVYVLAVIFIEAFFHLYL